jgi:hypothetical protein
MLSTKVDIPIEVRIVLEGKMRKDEITEVEVIESFLASANAAMKERASHFRLKEETIPENDVYWDLVRSCHLAKDYIKQELKRKALRLRIKRRYNEIKRSGGESEQTDNKTTR